MTHFFAALALIAASAPAGDRVRKLEDSLIAPCCWAEPITRHNSEVAAKMRAEIAAWVAEGKTDAEILGVYKERYGLRVLAEPEGTKFVWLSVVPWIALAAGLAVVILVIRKLRAPPAPASA